jgi:hypothetical protein
MNERIRELAEQAGMTRILDEHAHEYGNGMFENTPYPELEKFAELIVRECAELFPLTFTDEQYQRRIDKTILKHFGVEK